MVAAVSLYTPALTRNKRLVSLTLLDPTLDERDLRAAGVVSPADTIEPDLVRQWRDSLSRRIALAGSATAYVRWDKALLLTGLARESRMPARQRRLTRAVFEVRIG
jgi:hypothetical protein